MATSVPTRFGAGLLESRLARPAQVIVVGSLTFSLVATWRAAAIVLSDLSSTPYYIRLVETAIGPAAPFLVLGMALVGHALHSGWIESSTLPAGRVCRVVQGSLGGLLTRLAVFVLVLDYLFTGPARIAFFGRYFAGLLARLGTQFRLMDGNGRVFLQVGVPVAAIMVAFYLVRLNSRGADGIGRKGLKTKGVAAVTVAMMVVCCSLAPWIRDGSANRIRRDLPPQPIASIAAGDEGESMGFAGHALADLARKLRHSRNWLSLAGLACLVLAFLRCAVCASTLSAMRSYMAGEWAKWIDSQAWVDTLRTGRPRFAGPPG